MIIAYTALHYGAEYLEWSIRSVIDCVDEYHVLYSTIGSHGHRVNERPPDTKAELYNAARRAAQKKLRWHDGVWAFEGAQRDSIYTYQPKADCVLVLDADEVWGEGLARMALDVSAAGEAKDWTVPIIHYWRSFRRCVLHDPAFPVRIIYPQRAPLLGTIPHDADQHVINHFGYAQRVETVEYKLKVHGHKNEMNGKWYNEVFLTNRQYDCHPVGSDWWNPQTVDPLQYMPAWMQEHPNFHKELIG